MKNIFLATVFTLATSSSVFAAGLTLTCDGTPYGDHLVTITGVATNQISTNEMFALNSKDSFVNRTFDGDCKVLSKNYDCYEDGQFMVNIPKNVEEKIGGTVKAWINTDTDDNTDNNSIGLAYECKVSR